MQAIKRKTRSKSQVALNVAFVIALHFYQFRVAVHTFVATGAWLPNLAMSGTQMPQIAGNARSLLTGETSVL